MKSKLFYILLIITLASACKKDVDELLWSESLVEEIEAIGIDAIFEALQDEAESFVVNANSPIDLWTSGNIWLRSPANAILDNEGNVVEGEVEIRILYVLTKSDMVRYRAPTMTADGRFLESGGEIFVQAYRNNQPLVFDSSQTFSVNIPNGSPQSDMDYFVGQRNVDGNVEWELAPDLGSEFGNPTINDWAIGDSNEFDFGYELLCDRFGWQNIDKFLDSFGEPASDNRVSVSLPAGYGNNNTIAFCILDDFQTVSTLFADVDNEQFYIEGIPVGTNVTLVLVSLEEDNGVETSYAEVISIVVETDHHVVLSTMTERSAAEIDALLDAI